MWPLYVYCSFSGFPMCITLLTSLYFLVARAYYHFSPATSTHTRCNIDDVERKARANNLHCITTNNNNTTTTTPYTHHFLISSPLLSFLLSFLSHGSRTELETAYSPPFILRAIEFVLEMAFLPPSPPSPASSVPLGLL